MLMGTKLLFHKIMVVKSDATEREKTPTNKTKCQILLAPCQGRLIKVALVNATQTPKLQTFMLQGILSESTGPYSLGVLRAL